MADPNEATPSELPNEVRFITPIAGGTILFFVSGIVVAAIEGSVAGFLIGLGGVGVMVLLRIAVSTLTDVLKSLTQERNATRQKLGQPQP